MLKMYPKTYEDVYTREKKLKKCIKEYIETDNNISGEELIRKFTEIFEESALNLWNFLIKYYWLKRRFCYKGKKLEDTSFSGATIRGAWGVFNKKFLNFDTKFWQKDEFIRIMSYIEEFYPNFDLESPYEYDYEYPFKYMNFCCLSTVFRMQNRLELLTYGEKEKMSYIQFFDWILNWISSYNEEKGKTIFFLYSSSCFLPYIQAHGNERYKPKNNRFKANSVLRIGD